MSAPRAFSIVLALILVSAAIPDGANGQTVLVNDRLELITFNIAGGAGVYSDLAPVVDEITDLIASQKPIVVALQEVPVDHPHYPGDAVAMIKLGLKLKGYPMHIRSMEYGSLFPYLRLVVLSKYPISDYQELNAGAPFEACSGPRPSQTFRVVTAEHLFRVFNYHGCTDVYANDSAMSFLGDVESFYGENSMIVLMGDFNLAEGDPRFVDNLDIIREDFFDSCSSGWTPHACSSTVAPGSGHAAGKIDYVWLRHGAFSPYVSRWNPRYVWAEQSINDDQVVSDHLPLIAEVFVYRYR